MKYQDTKALRRAAVAQAVANLRARGVVPKPAVIALYKRYSEGELSWQEVQTAMWARAEALLCY